MPKPNRARCVELILEYGQKHPSFLQGILESYVDNLANQHVERFLTLLTPKPASLGGEGEGFRGRGNHGQET